MTLTWETRGLTLYAEWTHPVYAGHAIVEPGGKWTIGGRNLNASGEGGCRGAEDFLRAIGVIK